MKKRLMAALLCVCLLTGCWAATAIASSATDSGTSDDLLTGDANAEGAYSSRTVTGEDLDAAADGAYTEDIDIYAQALDGDGTQQISVYKVEIVWGDMAFKWVTGTITTEGWDPSTHQKTYSDTEKTGTWAYVTDGTLDSTLLWKSEDTSAAGAVTGTTQSYVLLFNHSDKGVSANVSLQEINAPENGDDDSITVTLASDDTYGVAGTGDSANGFTYALEGVEAGEAMYMRQADENYNSTSAAAYVELPTGEPTDGALNDTAPTTIARITVLLSISDGDTTTEGSGTTEESGNTEEGGGTAEEGGTTGGGDTPAEG